MPVEIELLLANHKFKSFALTYGKEMYTDHWLVPGGLPENSAATLHGIAVIRVRHKSTNVLKKVLSLPTCTFFLHRGQL